MTCWLWNLLTGDVEPVARAACFWIASASAYLSDPMWDAPLPLDRFVA